MTDTNRTTDTEVENDHAVVTTDTTNTSSPAMGNEAQHHYQEGEMDNDGFEHHYSGTSGAAGSATQSSTGTGSVPNTVTGSQTSRNSMEGSESDDHLLGGTQTDIMDGGNGSDRLEGNDGDDVLIGGASADNGQNHYVGGAGDDIMVAGGHRTNEFDHFVRTNAGLNEAIHGNAKFASVANIIDNGGIATTGQNTFEFQTANTGHDSILNFHVETDQLVIQRNINGSDIQDIASLVSHASLSGNDVTFDLGDGNSVTLVGVDAAGLSMHNIAFV